MHTLPSSPPFFNSQLLPVPHGMFSRHGGVGPPPHDSLNLSFGVGDHRENVLANRELVKQCLGVEHLCSAHQVHDDKIAVVASCRPGEEVQGYDALITDRPGTGLLVQQADCQGVLLHDPHRGVIAAVHCGWRGSVLNIIGRTVEKLEREFKTDPGNLMAVISPSLGPCCAEFVNFHKELPLWMHPFQVRRNFFDFWAISRIQLRQAGVRPGRIDTTGICTRCNTDFFSYRRSTAGGKKQTGRNGSVIALPLD